MKIKMSICKWTYRNRGILVSPPLLFAIFSFFDEIEVDYLIWPLGISIFLLGLLLRIWAQEHIHYRLKTEGHLTTTGPYTSIRNPIYLGNTLICVSATILSELLWLVPITIIWCGIVYSLVVRYEEENLLELYGEQYHKYMSEVPRWFPHSFKNAKNLMFKNEYLSASLIAEIQCLFALLPPILKEIISFWINH
ncbi:MAG TPA: isoprenylcysteine carboxylmethyltransferase family protein [Candidatus Ratteibacteria bacterium]|nr:isoprenylcysteine carboxylmethyltransferase family protein [bacterium]HRR96423.1 isoprenylcysteine carboxylmethyltransferase family protein [Candidatus Ratteibacteria bacterium]